MIKSLSIILLVIMTSVLISCNKTTTKQTITEQDLAQFITEKNINVIDTIISGGSSIILFDDSNTKNQIGYYFIYKDDNGDLIDQLVFGMTNNSAPIYTFGSTSNLKFLGVILNDKVLHSANIIEVIFDDQTSYQRKLIKNGAIFTYNRKNTISNIIIYDLDDKIIYSSK